MVKGIAIHVFPEGSSHHVILSSYRCQCEAIALLPHFVDAEKCELEGFVSGQKVVRKSAPLPLLAMLGDSDLSQYEAHRQRHAVAPRQTPSCCQAAGTKLKAPTPEAEVSLGRVSRRPSMPRLWACRLARCGPRRVRRAALAAHIGAAMRGTGPRSALKPDKLFS